MPPQQTFFSWRMTVTEQPHNEERDADGVADSIAATGIIAVVILTLYIWLSGMPS
jgi:hypothetical protein